MKTSDRPFISFSGIIAICVTALVLAIILTPMEAGHKGDMLTLVAIGGFMAWLIMGD